MIKINMLSTEKQQLNAAVTAALEAIRSRSYSARNPHLGKMIKCQICLRRHREIVKCELRYSTGRWADDQPLIASQTTVRGVMGASRFSKKRFHPHPNKRGLLLVERTQQLFPQHQPFYTKPEDAMKAARTEALRQLKAERRHRRRVRNKQQDISRRINAGLEKPGKRMIRLNHDVRFETKMKRQEKQAARTKTNKEVDSVF